jgi:hypothetical protein
MHSGCLSISREIRTHVCSVCILLAKVAMLKTYHALSKRQELSPNQEAPARTRRRRIGGTRHSTPGTYTQQTALVKEGKTGEEYDNDLRQQQQEEHMLTDDVNTAGEGNTNSWGG